MTPRIQHPSDEVVAKLAQIAIQAQSLMAPDNPSGRLRVGVTKLQNERRRAGEKILVLLADPGVRAYLARVNAKPKTSAT